MLEPPKTELFVIYLEIFILIIKVYLQVRYPKLFQMIVVLGIGGTLPIGYQISVINYPSTVSQKVVSPSPSPPWNCDDPVLLWVTLAALLCQGCRPGPS